MSYRHVTWQNIKLVLKNFLLYEFIFLSNSFLISCFLAQKTEQWHKLIYYSLENYSLSIRHSSSAIKHFKMQKSIASQWRRASYNSRMNIMTWKKTCHHVEKEESLWENIKDWKKYNSHIYFPNRTVLNKVLVK